jgi:hypothetical protein
VAQTENEIHPRTSRLPYAVVVGKKDERTTPASSGPELKARVHRGSHRLGELELIEATVAIGTGSLTAFFALLELVCFLARASTLCAPLR